MDFLDNAIEKARETFNIVSKKTEEVVTVGKQKFDISSLENKRTKDFENLGEIYYGLIKDTEIEDPKIKSLVDAITDKNNQINQLKEEINSTKDMKTCPNCQSTITKTAVYCSSCGAKLNFED